MAVLGLQNANERQAFLIAAAVLGVMAAVLIALAPAKLSSSGYRRPIPKASWTRVWRALLKGGAEGPVPSRV